jgi:integrase/recombinase XerD
MRHDGYEQSIRALPLNGLGERTQEAYTRAVRMRVEFYGKTPDRITETELQAYFLHRKNVDQWAASTRRIGYAAIRFFFVPVLHRDWHTLVSIVVSIGSE